MLDEVDAYDFVSRLSDADLRFLRRAMHEEAYAWQLDHLVEEVEDMYLLRGLSSENLPIS